MSASKIEWTEETWNPVIGCTRVSEGCRNCYAERMSARLAAMADADVEKGTPPSPRTHNYTRVVKYNDGIALPQWNNKVVTVPEALDEPLRRKKQTVYFVNSMSDLFHKDVPFDFIDRVFAVMALCPQHTFQVLTKRPERNGGVFQRADRRDSYPRSRGLRDGRRAGARQLRRAGGDVLALVELLARNIGRGSGDGGHPNPAPAALPGVGAVHQLRAGPWPGRMDGHHGHHVHSTCFEMHLHGGEKGTGVDVADQRRRERSRRASITPRLASRSARLLCASRRAVLF
jgi:hypothetical protein